MNITTALATGYISVSQAFNRRGFYSFMRLINRLFPHQANQSKTVELNAASNFSFPAGDPYWLSVFVCKRDYEPELRRLLARLERPSLFLDCGANFGYWSVLNSEHIKTVAVEASTDTYRWLALNNANNKGRFTALHAAITDGSTATVTFALEGAHAGRSVVADAQLGETIPAVSIDKLVEQYADDDGLIFIKLNVEGVEVDAFRGATKTFARNSVFLYEDHGRDASCAPTAHLLQEGRRVYFLLDDDSLLRIESVERARELKTNRSKGYNFIALGDACGEF